mmetsp:Transcript_70948/g.169919  ORF Transcript_70948/g.169919 Transcript_70948/m.169919 type:complete len:717 (+) Transcript_70948:128-2278(+)
MAGVKAEANVKVHDPDKPLAVDVPWLQTKQADIFAQVRLQAGQPQTLPHENEWEKSGKADTGGGHASSRSVRTVTLRIQGSKEEFSYPMETSTTVREAKQLLAYKFYIDTDSVQFVKKQGCSFRQMSDSDEMPRDVVVKGIKSFKRPWQKYDYPKAVIGCGHIGIKQAITFMDAGDEDFIIFDRMSVAGGTSWMYQANATSKLQTEFGAYHLPWRPTDPIPKDEFTSPWPSRNRLLDHFRRIVADYGISPYCRMSTNVKEMNIVFKAGAPKSGYDRWDGHVDHYCLTTEHLKAGRLKYGRLTEAEGDGAEDESIKVSAVAMYPGNLTLPRMVTYHGEESFEGQIGYGMFDEVDYDKVEGDDVAVIGHGAFAVENVRTCCEYGCGKAYLICRRKNIACPRVVSWMANRTLSPLSCKNFLDFMIPMYDMINVDPWSYYAVKGNKAGGGTLIEQKARFGIGDIYFLAIYMGKLEVVVDPGIKRLSKHCVHLEGGRKIGCKHILKLLGFTGELDVDNLMNVNDGLLGFWADGDARRTIVAEPVSVMATKMGATSFSPGARGWSDQTMYFFHYPQDLKPVRPSLPNHKVDYSDEGTIRPSYVVDARHGTSTGVAIGMFTRGLNEVDELAGVNKAVKHRLCHPAVKFLAAAKEDWDYYANRFLKEGYGKDKPYPEYPYRFENTKELIMKHMGDAQEPPLLSDVEDLKLSKSEISSLTKMFQQ